MPNDTTNNSDPNSLFHPGYLLKVTAVIFCLVVYMCFKIAYSTPEIAETPLAKLSDISPAHTALVGAYQDCRALDGEGKTQSECHLFVKRYAEELGFSALVPDVIEAIIAIEQ